MFRHNSDPKTKDENLVNRINKTTEWPLFHEPMDTFRREFRQDFFWESWERNFPPITMEGERPAWKRITYDAYSLETEEEKERFEVKTLNDGD